MSSTPPPHRDRRDLLDKLEQQVKDLRRSDRWAAYLRCQARFHRYSPRNVLLISLQRPDATQVAGYRVWQSLGRQVRRGERAISILAPLRSTSHDEEEPRVVGFRWVAVFDIEQTDGAPLASPIDLLVASDAAGLEARLESVACSFGLTVAHETLPVGVNGELRWATNTLAVSATNPGLQRAKTLAHELGHFLLHRHEANRARAEIEAESVAFVVLAAFGADSSRYSAGYVASWLEHDEQDEAITRSCEVIHRAATIIIDRLASLDGQTLRPTARQSEHGAA